MYHGLIIAALLIACGAALFFSSLTVALRDFSRLRLQSWLKRHGREALYQRAVDKAEELSFLTAVLRLLCNTGIFVCALALIHDEGTNRWLEYGYGFLITIVLAMFVSVVIPLAIARHAGEMLIGLCLRFLFALYYLMLPAVKLMAAIDRLVGKAAGPQTQEQEQQQIEEQILTAVEEGEKEGVVDEQEREMIESVIEFRDSTASEVMTARTDIVAFDRKTSLPEVKATFDRTGLSRVPVYEETLDHIIGVLYARDLLKYVGESAATFEMEKAIRPAFFVPETKPLRHLLSDFRQMKIHMAVVLDEYGGTAGLVTIEDVLEQLVGEISDEHEPHEPSMVRKLDDKAWEVDARITIPEFNGVVPVNVPEDEEIHTLGGYVATQVGRIPEKGAVVNLPGMTITVLDAEPRRINRLRVEVTSAA